MRFLLAIVMLFGTVRTAISATVDWKLYGGVSKSQAVESQYCFYEERGITRDVSTGFVRVWAKCLKQKDLDGDYSKKPYGRAVIDMAASRIAHYYFPPILKVQRASNDQTITTIAYETLADLAEDFDPTARMYYEIDCRGKRVRPLSGNIGAQSFSQPLEWENVPPEGNAANLHELLCPLT